MTLKALLDPSSIAIIGASDSPDKIGGRPIRYLKEFGFTGSILPVNPGRPKVQGLDAFPSVADLPEVPDVAIIAVAGENAVESVDACAEKGVKAAIIMASGFGETGAAGKALEARMRERARGRGMRLVGPNSQGLANFGTGAILSFSTMFIESPPQDGTVACISQSGAMSVVPYGLLRARGIGVRHVHSTGNDCDVTVSELAAAVVDDPEVRLILLYLETLSDPENLALAARKARQRGLPIIALKAGRSEDGRRAASSHTGAIATPDRVIDAFFEKLGIWRADGVPDMVRATELYLGGWKPRGRKLAVISNSGATCVLAADAAERFGLPLAEFKPETCSALKSVLPSFAATNNPVDLTAALLTNSGLFSEVLPVVGADRGVDLTLVGIPVSGQGYDYPRFARDTADYLKAGDKPVVAAIPQDKVRTAFASEGIPTFVSEDDAVNALTQFVRHHERMATAKDWTRVEIDPDRPRKMLDESQSLDLLDAFGITTMRRRLCREVAEAVAFQKDLGRPIVLKACSAEIPHKSEHGLVLLRLDTEEAVAEACNRITSTLERMGVPFQGLLAAEMLSGERELVVGGHLDPVFGPVVMIGDGGVLVEAVPDNVLLLPDLDQAEIEGALDCLRIAPLFSGVRGKPPLDRAAIVNVVQAVSRLLLDGQTHSVDVNPLIVSPSGAVAVDALVEQYL
mgnify:CR=1 FL=1